MSTVSVGQTIQSTIPARLDRLSRSPAIMVLGGIVELAIGIKA